MATVEHTVTVGADHCEVGNLRRFGLAQYLERNHMVCFDEAGLSVNGLEIKSTYLAKESSVFCEKDRLCRLDRKSVV